MTLEKFFNWSPAEALCTDEFLASLVTVAKCYGWTGNYLEISKFVEWCYKKGGKELPENLEPYGNQ
jgi:hypothetical protein